MQRKTLPVGMTNPGAIVALLLAASVSGWAQSANGPASAPTNDVLTQTVQELQRQVGELREAVAEVRSEAAQYRAETVELRHELQEMRTQTAATASSQPAAAAPAPSGQASAAEEEAPRTLEQRVASLEESSQLLDSKLNDQYQTKVESASKYRLRLSGIVLMNLFSNRGSTDNQDVPSFVTGPNTNGNFGATLRQSEIGLEAFGPTLAGAKTSASLQADFAGGFPDTWNGVNSGFFRLRTASARLDWDHTSIVAGQDDLFISPLSPTSFASLAVPALNYAGNLWAWTPQVRVEHRFDISDGQSILVQGGILDNLTGEFPAGSYFRSPGPGEQSSQPAYALRTAWTSDFLGRPITVGAAGYYSRQVWGFDRYVDGWAGMTDWDIPLTRWLGLTGEFFRGRGIGGIGGGISRSVVFNGDPSEYYTEVRGLDSIGGWSQLKFKVNSKWEFNAAFGLDNPTASEIRAGEASQAYVGPLLTQNRGAFVNFVYRPRSNLLFSTEYRFLQSFPLYQTGENAEQLNMIMGVLF
jgi:regulator of replication initiation timing